METPHRINADACAGARDDEMAHPAEQRGEEQHREQAAAERRMRAGQPGTQPQQAARLDPVEVLRYE